ncbi:Alpha/Beta hydrolase protein [Lipomyces japonicus]|uniref:Alpha/Beta hydrolase protein n=1 Tax=Lipomyces japonicus TaxID=56871 RepID=UPI0034CF646E
MSAPEPDSQFEYGRFSLPSNPKIKIAYKFLASSDLSLPVIALSNSLSSNYDILWQEFVEHFKDKYSIILYDQRFHGLSPLAEDAEFDYFNKGLRFEDLADDIVALLDHLKIARLHALVGLSMGATTTLLSKDRHHSRIGKIVASGSGLKSAPPGQADVFEPRIKTATSPGGIETLASQTLDRWFPGEDGKLFLEHHTKRKDELLNMLHGATPEGFVASVRALQNFDLTTALKNIKQRGESDEVLILSGSEDGPLPNVAVTLGELSGGQVKILDKSGHITNIQKAEEFNKIVEEFIS